MTHALRNRMTAVLCSILLTAAQLPAALPLHAQAAGVYAQLYVSPDGDDSNAGTLSAPLKTLAGARDAVRKIKDGMTGDIVVNFRGGVYRMTEAVSFETQDSAPDGCRIIYQAYEDKTPVFRRKAGHRLGEGQRHALCRAPRPRLQAPQPLCQRPPR